MASYFILTLAVLTVLLELGVINTQGFQLRYHDPCTNSQMTCGSNMTCSRQRLCECLPGFFPHIYTCSQSLAPDTKCDTALFDSRQCVDNARCNVHTRICECVTGYYSNGTACKTPLLKYNATCNSSRAVQCALPAVCNKITSTCDCPLAHFNNNKGICTPRISLHSKCDFHEPNHRQCVDDAACTKSGTEYACMCQSGFFVIGTHCSPRVKAGEVCNNKITEPLQCGDHAHCDRQTPNRCTCDLGFFNNNTVCAAMILAGRSCNANITDLKQCVNNAICRVDTSTNTWACLCQDNFFNNMGSCYPRLVPMQSCSISSRSAVNQCVDNATCDRALHICVCRLGLFLNTVHGICEEGLKVGYPCDYRVRDPMQCLNNSHCPPRGHGSACTCDIGYFQNGARCDLAILDGNSCDKTVPDPKQCVTNASCQENSTNTSICRCNDNFFNHFSSCQPRLAPMQACDIISRIGDNQCFDNATCDHILRICVCKPGLFLNTVEGTCKEGLKVGDHCDYRIRDPLQCLNNSHCPLSGQGSTCTCDNRYFQNDTHCDLVRLAGHTCDRKIVDPPQCVSNSQCGNTSICLCKEGFYNNSGVCAVRLLPLARCNPSVPDDKQCVDSVTCDPNLHVCICHNGLFPDVVKGTCDNVTLGICSTLTSNVTHIEECPDHAHCVNDSCRCDNGFKEDNSQTCVPDIQKVPAGLQCNPTTDKCVSNATCSSVGQVSVCHCDVDFYDRAGQCVRLMSVFHSWQ